MTKWKPLLYSLLSHRVTAGVEVTANSRINEDLKLDSLDVVEALVLLESELMLELDEAPLMGCRTVGEIVEKLEIQTGSIT